MSWIELSDLESGALYIVNFFSFDKLLVVENNLSKSLGMVGIWWNLYFNAGVLPITQLLVLYGGGTVLFCNSQ